MSAKKTPADAVHEILQLQNISKQADSVETAAEVNLKPKTKSAPAQSGQDAQTNNQ